MYIYIYPCTKKKKKNCLSDGLFVIGALDPNQLYFTILTFIHIIFDVVVVGRLDPKQLRVIVLLLLFKSVYNV